MSRVRVARTLLVSQVKNLTEREIWAYGTSGELIKIAPAEIQRSDDQLPPPEEGVYYIVDLNSDAAIRRDGRYRSHLLLAKYMGDGVNGQAIYNLLMAANEEGRMKVLPITERYGLPGEIVVYREYTTTRHYEAAIRHQARARKLLAQA